MAFQFSCDSPKSFLGLYSRARAAVLNNLSEQVRDCLQHAEDCGRKAAAQTDPELRDDFLRLEKRWLELARSMEFVERLGAFTTGRAKPDKLNN